MSETSYYLPSTNQARNVRNDGTFSGLEQSTYTVLAVAGARVYHTKLSDKDDGWTYSRWKGSLSLCRDIDSLSALNQGISDGEKYWFRLADEETGRTVWMFRFPENFEYIIDRPFFHVFQGRTRRYGFLYNDDDEAALFGQKVFSQIYNNHNNNNGRGYLRQKLTLYQILANLLRPRSSDQSKKARSKSNLNDRPAKRSKSLSTSVSRSMISSPAPNSFKHVTHIGVGENGVFEASSELDDSWKAMLGNLQGYGVSEETVIRHSDFVEGFWKGVEAARVVEPDHNDEGIQKEMSRKMTTISAL